ncbi:MAG: hypothetical protein HC900_11155 [Methylacidiphilales bacterium]|nr:hypothetical protein [Candidatus Methylacidiphilales bacterium]
MAIDTMAVGTMAIGIAAIGRLRHAAGVRAFILTHTSPALYLKQKNAFL